MKIVEASELAKSLLVEHGLTDKGWKLDWLLAGTTFGRCRYIEKTIYLSGPLVSRNTLELVKDTILHEIAHALTGPGHHHDSYWQETATRIGAAPTRCYSDEVIEPPKRYIATCKTCGKVSEARKMPSRRKSCGACSPTFNERFLLTYEKRVFPVNEKDQR